MKNQCDQKFEELSKDTLQFISGGVVIYGSKLATFLINLLGLTNEPVII